MPNPETKIADLESSADKDERSGKQKRARADNLRARLYTKWESEETTRKIELGALLLEHMRHESNAGSYVVEFCWELLNNHVRDFRRYLFQEFGISPDPPPGSASARHQAARNARRAAKARKDTPSNDKEKLADRFKQLA